MSDIVLSTANVPDALCGLTWQQAWPQLVALITAQLNANIRNFNFGPNEPEPDRRDDPWLKTDSLFTPERWYTYSGGLWLARHPLPPGTIALYLAGGEVAVRSFDGGDGGLIGTVTDTSGPMWYKADEFDAKVPLGIGTLPISSTVVTIGATGGLEKVQLTTGQLPKHTPATAAGGNFYVYVPGSGTFTLSSTGGTDATSSPMNQIGNDEKHENMPPYVGAQFIKRTARLHYRAT